MAHRSSQSADYRIHPIGRMTVALLKEQVLRGELRSMRAFDDPRSVPRILHEGLIQTDRRLA